MDGAAAAAKPPPERHDGSSSSSSSSGGGGSSQLSGLLAGSDAQDLCPIEDAGAATPQEQQQQQQQQQQQGFEDVEVHMVCPATAAWAAARSSSSNTSSSSSAAAAEASNVLRGCQWLVMARKIRKAKWRSCLVLQGELLHFGVVLLPLQHTAAATGDPAAVKAWLEKCATLSASVDLLLRDSSSSGSSKAARQSALSCRFWEAQAFPIDSQETVSVKITHWLYTPTDTAAAAAGGGKGTLEEVTECCIICDITIPMTVNPQCLGLPLSLECLFRLSPRAAIQNNKLNSIRGNINVPISAWAAASGISAATTQGLKPSWSLSQPIPALACPPVAAAAASTDRSSNSSSSSVCSGSTTTASSNAAAGAAAARATQQQQQPAGPLADSSSYSSRLGSPRVTVSSPLSLPGDRVSLSMELMMQALGSTAVMADLGTATEETADDSKCLRVSSQLTVQRPLQVTTARMDSFMYVQIENSTDSIPVVVENVILRSVNSNAQGDLPVTLRPQEQHSVLLRLEESFLSFGAAQWGGPGADCSKGSMGPAGGDKAVLPLCLKWHVAGSSGPAVWSQYGAECQLPLRPPLQVSVTCLSDGCEGGVLTAVLSVTNHGVAEVDLLALLPRDLHYSLHPMSPVPVPAAPAAAAAASAAGSRHSSSNRQTARAAHETPALIPLNSKRDLGRVSPGSSQSVYLQFLATRCGLHALPPLLLVDRKTNRKILAKGGQVLIMQ